MAGKPKTPAPPPLRTDFHDAQVTELLGKPLQGTLLKREGLRTELLQRTHIGMGCGNDGGSVKVQMAQIHEAHNLGGIVHKANCSDGNNNSNYNSIDGNNSTTSFRYEGLDGLYH